LWSRTPNMQRWHTYVATYCLWSRSPTHKNTKHAQMTYTCGHILLVKQFGALGCWWTACEAEHQTCKDDIHTWPHTTCEANHQQTRTPNTHRWHTHAATYCVIIQTQRTQISVRNSNGTKRSGGPPEDGREKWPKRVGVLYLQTRF
jgi:hypothetical protein